VSHANGSNHDAGRAYYGAEAQGSSRITDAIVEEAGARREAVVVAFHEVSKESYASGGVLMVDKVK